MVGYVVILIVSCSVSLSVVPFDHPISSQAMTRERREKLISTSERSLKMRLLLTSTGFASRFSSKHGKLVAAKLEISHHYPTAVHISHNTSITSFPTTAAESNHASIFSQRGSSSRSPSANQQCWCSSIHECQGNQVWRRWSNRHVERRRNLGRCRPGTQKFPFYAVAPYKNGILRCISTSSTRIFVEKQMVVVMTTAFSP